MSLKPAIGKPPPVAGSCAVPPGMVALYAALVATVFGTMAWTAMSWSWTTGEPRIVAEQTVAGNAIRSPFVVTAPAARPKPSPALTMVTAAIVETVALRRARVRKKRSCMCPRRSTGSPPYAEKGSLRARDRKAPDGDPQGPPTRSVTNSSPTSRRVEPHRSDTSVHDSRLTDGCRTWLKYYEAPPGDQVG